MPTEPEATTFVGLNGFRYAKCPACHSVVPVTSEFAASPADLRKLLEDALERMDRARNILTNDAPSWHCNWGMLDTKDIRSALAAPAWTTAAPTVPGWKFNINDYVRVRLTEDGRGIDRMRYEEKFPRHLREKYPYRPPEENADGWSKWQLWHLMETFGRNISLGGILPFETTIELLPPGPTEATS